MLNVVKSIRLTRYCAGLFLFLLLTGCCSPSPRLTPFPPYSGFIESDEPAVLSHNRREETYVVTERMVNNAVINQIYIDAIHRWKRENSIR